MKTPGQIFLSFLETLTEENYRESNSTVVNNTALRGIEYCAAEYESELTILRKEIHDLNGRVTALQLKDQVRGHKENVRLKEAEEVIAFYADRYNGYCNSCETHTSLDEFAGIVSGQEMMAELGERAREYQKKYLEAK